jgi:hypothetical protein
MAVPRLPQTDLRLATSVSIFFLPESSISLATSFASIFAPRSTTTAVVNQMQQLDGIVSFVEEQSRELESRYEVDSDGIGSPLEIMASPVRHSFKLRRAVTYYADLISILGFNSLGINSSQGIPADGTVDGGLLAQAISNPYIFIKREISPSGGDIVTFYRNCLIGNISRDTSVVNSLGVYEDANIYYADRQLFTS